eukprot:Rmarinus@m.3710
MPDEQWVSLAVPELAFRLKSTQYSEVVENEFRKEANAFSVLLDEARTGMNARTNIVNFRKGLKVCHEAAVSLLTKRVRRLEEKRLDLKVLLAQFLIYYEVAEQRLIEALVARREEVEKRLSSLVYRCFVTLEEERRIAAEETQAYKVELSKLALICQGAQYEDLFAAYLTAESLGRAHLDRLPLGHPFLSKVEDALRRHLPQEWSFHPCGCGVHQGPDGTYAIASSRDMSFDRGGVPPEERVPGKVYGVRVISVSDIRNAVVRGRVRNTAKACVGMQLQLEWMFFDLPPNSMEFSVVNGLGALTEEELASLLAQEWATDRDGQPRSYIREVLKKSKPLHGPHHLTHSPFFARQIETVEENPEQPFMYVLFCDVLVAKKSVLNSVGAGNQPSGEIAETPSHLLNAVEYDAEQGTCVIRDAAFVRPTALVRLEYLVQPVPPPRPRQIVPCSLPRPTHPVILEGMRYASCWYSVTATPEHDQEADDTARSKPARPSSAQPKASGGRSQNRPQSGRKRPTSAAGSQDGRVTATVWAMEKEREKEKGRSRTKAALRNKGGKEVFEEVPEDDVSQKGGCRPGLITEDRIWEEGVVNFAASEFHEEGKQLREVVRSRILHELAGYNDYCAKRIKREVELIHAARLRAIQWMRVELERWTRKLSRERERTSRLQLEYDTCVAGSRSVTEQR